MLISKSTLKSILIASFCSAVFNISAQDRYVAVSGTDIGDCSDPMNSCASLAYAIGQSDPGDDIYISDGVYAVSVMVVVDKSVTVTGQSQLNTILELQTGSNTLMEVTTGGVELNAFTLRVNPGHGDFANTNLLNPYDNFLANHITFQGAGFDGVRSTGVRMNMMFENCSFIQNRNGFRVASDASADEVTFNNCLFEGNTNLIGSGTFGISNSNETVSSAKLSNLIVQGCEFINFTSAAATNSGMYFENVDSIYINRNHFVNSQRGITFVKFNRGDPDNMENIIIDSNLFENNSAFGITMFSFTNHGYNNVSLSCNTFMNNEVGFRTGLSGGGDWVDFHINNNNFLGNISQGILMSNVLLNNQVIDATNNFWGSSNGPTHSSNPGGTGDVIGGAGSDDSIVFIPFLSRRACVSETPIPAIGEWGLLILTLLILTVAIIGIKQNENIMGLEKN